MNMQLHEQSKMRQNGFVAIIVASMIMVILALITIGFTRMMQREQRQALDRQLTRQALYAAESGINEINDILLADATLQEKTDCDVGSLFGSDGAKLDIDGDIEYTCALYDKSPTELVYEIGTVESEIVPLISESEKNFGKINVQWGSKDGFNNVGILPDCGSDNAREFPAARSNAIPILKFDLTDTSSYKRYDLIQKTDYMYLVPCKGSTASEDSGRGKIVEVLCKEGGLQPCKFELSLGGVSNSYISRVKPIYATATISITGDGSTLPNNPVEFRSAQTSIDVTARANDIVRRLRASIPQSSPEGAPEAVFQVMGNSGVCKLLSVNPTDVEDPCS